MEPVRALYFGDVLCVWAYVSQLRVEQLRSELGAEVEVETRFCSVFGDVPGKLSRGWAERGGVKGYAEHVRRVLAPHPQVRLDPATWGEVAPNSSTPAHLALCAVRLLERGGQLEPQAFHRACCATREAFFARAMDIGNRAVLSDLLASLDLPVTAIDELIGSGLAFAELAADAELARTFEVKLSPTILLNEGRQRLNGNVGYRVIEANVRELLHKPEATEASWC